MQPEPDPHDAVVARVVAWHNRHPLARRITPAQVDGVGVVSLPYAVRGATVEPLPVAADAAVPAADTDAAPPAAPPTSLQRQVQLPPRPSGSARGWWQRLRGRQAFRALFSEDFIAPLRPRRVAAWVADHGSPQWPLAPTAPLRQVAPDPSRRRPGDDAPEIELYVVTAAIEAGGRRCRVLLASAGDAAVIGPRLIGPARVAAAAAPLVALLLTAFAALLGTRGDAPAAATAVAAASVPASAAASAVASASPAPAASVAVVVVAAGAPPAASVPTSEPPRPGRVELAPLVPRLAAGERQALRAAAQNLRRADAQAAPPPAWALATPPRVDRRHSERAAAQLQALALLQRMPMRAELMRSGNAWRAVFWPFSSAADAEKVRLALADKGLATELVEF